MAVFSTEGIIPRPRPWPERIFSGHGPARLEGRFQPGRTRPRSTQAPWPLTVIGATETANAHGQVHGAVAALSAPGFPASTLTMCDSSPGVGCTIKWGDGSTSIGDVTGTNATGTKVNSLYTIFGEHTYPHPGTYRGVVIVSAGSSKPVRADFTVTWP